MEEEHRDKPRPHIHCCLIFAFVVGGEAGSRGRKTSSRANYIDNIKILVLSKEKWAISSRTG